MKSAGANATRNPLLPAQPNQSLLDGLEVLRALALTGSPVGGRELARTLGLDVMRTNRLLKTLAYAGLARQTPGRKYEPGPGMHVLSAQMLYASRLLARAQPPLDELERTARRGVALGVLWRDQVCYLYHHAGPGHPWPGAAGRDLFPAVRSSVGMMLLAHAAPAALDELLDRGLADGFDGGRRGLRARLATIRAAGHAHVVQRAGEPFQGSLAVPVGDPAAPYAAVALMDVRPADVDALLPPLRAAAAKIA
jgi:DNA-binding IclR family transcriptional regulator